ncbi:MAG TPA: hypothetical protein VFS31_12045, partial [Chitinophagaceae bacterium]|nr:hypothetical protein [Chitinophagaceae bacterium]
MAPITFKDLKHPGKIQLEEHTYKPPPLPRDTNEILFINEPIEKQYWRRQTDLPPEFEGYGPLTRVNAEYTQWQEVEGVNTVIALSKADTDKVREYRDRELKRRREGVWFMNKGVPTYLTGDHYFALQWCPINGLSNPFDNGSPYGAFRWFQAKFFYFLEVCGISYVCDPALRISNKRPKCIGGYIVKPKKTGITLLVMYAFANRLTMTAALNAGAMSKSKEDCMVTNMTYFRHALDNLPYIFLPNIERDNLDFVRFDTPRAKNTGTKKSQMRQMGNGKGLNSFFKAAPTKADAFDGPVMHLENLDEFAKCEDPYPAVIYEKTIQTVKIGGMPNGLLLITHYTPETDGKSFEEGRKIFYDSELSTIDPMTGMTKSELFAYCISAKDSYETPDNKFNKYGFLDEDKALQNINSRREQLKADRQKLQSFMRQYPLNREEAWRQGGGGGSLFDNIRLGIRKSEIEDML